MVSQNAHELSKYFIVIRIGNKKYFLKTVDIKKVHMIQTSRLSIPLYRNHLEMNRK